MRICVELYVFMQTSVVGMDEHRIVSITSKKKKKEERKHSLKMGDDFVIILSFCKRNMLNILTKLLLL